LDSRIIDNKTYDFILRSTRLTNKEQPEEIITFYIDKIVNDITIKTNRNKFPEGLKYLVVEMLSDMFTLYEADTKPDQNQTVQSMSEQDRRVDFGINSYTQSKLDLLLNKKLEDNTKLINRYKLLYKVGGTNAEN